MPHPIRIAILRTGSTAAAVRAVYGDYDRWFIDAMAHHRAIRFEVHDITSVPIPSIAAYDGAIVTGSTSAVYAEEPWMAPLARFLREAVAGETPLLCVCFGAQILAHALGERVVRSPHGWEIGAIEIAVTPEGARDPVLEGIATGPDLTAAVLATHEDRIESIPDGAVLLAGNDVAPVQALRAGRCVWGVQFHPEITPAILEILIRHRREGIAQDARALGMADPETRADRLIEALSGRDTTAGRRVLDNFARVCAASREAVAGR